VHCGRTFTALTLTLLGMSVCYTNRILWIFLRFVPTVFVNEPWKFCNKVLSRFWGIVDFVVVGLPYLLTHPVDFLILTLSPVKKSPYWKTHKAFSLIGKLVIKTKTIGSNFWDMSDFLHFLICGYLHNINLLSGYAHCWRWRLLELRHFRKCQVCFLQLWKYLVTMWLVN